MHNCKLLLFKHFSLANKSRMWERLGREVGWTEDRTMWSLNETVFCNIAPLGLATLQLHCGCLAFQSLPARNLGPRESRKCINHCWEIFLSWKAKTSFSNHQFGFHHSTIHQCHRVVDTVASSLELGQYCTAAFLNVEQAFHKVWHEGLLSKLKGILPSIYFLILKSYLSNRHYQVSQNNSMSSIHPMCAGIPRGSIPGPNLYTIYSADTPNHPSTILFLCRRYLHPLSPHWSSPSMPIPPKPPPNPWRLRDDVKFLINHSKIYLQKEQKKKKNTLTTTSWFKPSFTLIYPSCVEHYSLLFKRGLLCWEFFLDKSKIKFNARIALKSQIF
jgi:hypothetical protein